MSWQDYVDNQLLASNCVSRAAIAGHDGGIWAKSEGFEVIIAFTNLFSHYFFFHFHFPSFSSDIVIEHKKNSYIYMIIAVNVPAECECAYV